MSHAQVPTTEGDNVEMGQVTVKVNDQGTVLGGESTKPATATVTPAQKGAMCGGCTTAMILFVTFVLMILTFAGTAGTMKKLDNEVADKLDKIYDKLDEPTTAFEYSGSGVALGFDDDGANYCAGSQPDDDAFNNFNCSLAVASEIEQAAANVTKGYTGAINNSATPPITTPYYQTGLCPVNVHWHLGAEHLSVGEYDSNGVGPYDDYAITDDDHTDDYSRKLRDAGANRKLASGGVRVGHQCHYYDEDDAKYTTAYNWEHCVDMIVGQTYEIHWPHSTVGACNTPYQYQTPFYDGVFCNYPSGGATTHNNVGVQSQTFTIVNDEAYYYPDLFRGMIVSGDFGDDMAIYTGSTTGTSRSNEVCSAYSPITWQVDRKCHLISASSFDKMCADMKAQVDDMSDDLYAHGSRITVENSLSSIQEDGDFTRA